MNNRMLIGKILLIIASCLTFIAAALCGGNTIIMLVSGYIFISDVLSLRRELNK